MDSPVAGLQPGSPLRDFWDRIIAVREIIDSQEFAVMSNRTRPAKGKAWGTVHWRTAESLVVLMPETYKITRRGRRIRNIKMHPEETGS